MTNPPERHLEAAPTPPTRTNKRSADTWVKVLGALIAAFLLLQLVPYGRAHANPAVQATPNWDSPQTEALFTRACADCHSNQTVWPWYSNVAPVSWLVQNHVEEGRSKFNINAAGSGHESGEAAETVTSGEMPERSYLLTHSEARLTPEETRALAAGLAQTFGREGGMGEEGEGGGSGEGHESDSDGD